MEYTGGHYWGPPGGYKDNRGNYLLEKSLLEDDGNKTKFQGTSTKLSLRETVGSCLKNKMKLFFKK